MPACETSFQLQSGRDLSGLSITDIEEKYHGYLQPTSLYVSYGMMTSFYRTIFIDLTIIIIIVNIICYYGNCDHDYNYCY